MLDDGGGEDMNAADRDDLRRRLLSGVLRQLGMTDGVDCGGGGGVDVDDDEDDLRSPI